MFRVWDIENKKWITSDVVMFANGDVAEIKNKKGILKKKTINLLSEEYIVNYTIGCKDSNDDMIYEGDILEAVNGTKGVVGYSIEQASYVCFDYDNSKWYPLGIEICKHLKITGNVYENPMEMG